jgi:hypothetical protein
MRILLIGEYSNFHTSLKTGLQNLGHEVLLAGKKDGFKAYPMELDLDPVFFSKKPFSYFRHLIYNFFSLDIGALETVLYFFINRSKFKNYDVVQLINEYPVKASPTFDRWILNYIFKHNKKVILSACGDDLTYIEFLLNSKLDYHILTPYLLDSSLKHHFRHSLKYLSPSHKRLSQFVIKNCLAIIPADVDYVMAYSNHPKAQPLIPFPINVEHHIYTPLKLGETIKIFHGINRINYHKKGNSIFEKALSSIKTKYGSKVEIITVENVPYSHYINLYNQAHIILDQVYSYDHGYNALEAMAKGKVVFSGFTNEFYNHYGLDSNNAIGLNTSPDAGQLVENLSFLIDNPEELIKISQNARAYVEQWHDMKKIAQNYIQAWELA